MAKRQKESFLESLIFLFPSRLIKKNHLSKKDVEAIKNNLTTSFSLVYLIVGAIASILMVGLHVVMQLNSNHDYVGKYGLMAFVGQLVLMVGGMIVVALVIISRNVKKSKTAVILSRIAGDLLFICTTTYLISCIYSDAKMGFTQHSETLSAGVIFIAILALIQPMHWLDALLLDFGVTFSMIGASTYCYFKFDMGALLYYILIALVFPLTAYLVVSLLFYAESQRYKEEMENEKLHNRAYYDSLTRCKNRHALSEYLKENKTRWNRKENINLLMVLFDIDNFKLYNDQFSHLGGDYCLKSICDAIRREFPSPSLDFFRYGGEEFLLFFELRNPDEAPMILEKIREAISSLEIDAPNGAPKKMVTISVGGMLLRNVKGFVFEDELKTVDKYLYQAKNSGKDVVCYNGQIIN